MAFSTAWSSNAVSICHACGLENVTRVERSRRFRLAPLAAAEGSARALLSEAAVAAFAALVGPNPPPLPPPFFLRGPTKPPPLPLLPPPALDLPFSSSITQLRCTTG